MKLGVTLKYVLSPHGGFERSGAFDGLRWQLSQDVDADVLQAIFDRFYRFPCWMVDVELETARRAQVGRVPSRGQGEDP